MATFVSSTKYLPKKSVCAFETTWVGFPTLTSKATRTWRITPSLSGGRGLTDFDAATMGPVVLDLVRFGVSIHLASRANGWEEEAEPIVHSFFSGYRAALEDPGLISPPPELVSRIRARFATDREQTLAARETHHAAAGGKPR